MILENGVPIHPCANPNCKWCNGLGVIDEFSRAMYCPICIILEEIPEEEIGVVD